MTIPESLNSKPKLSRVQKGCSWHAKVHALGSMRCCLTRMRWPGRACRAATSGHNYADVDSKEAFPVRPQSSDVAFGDLARCAYEESVEPATGMCLALPSRAGPFIAFGLSTGTVGVHRLPVCPPTDARTARCPVVFKLTPSKIPTQSHTPRQQVIKIYISCLS